MRLRVAATPAATPRQRGWNNRQLATIVTTPHRKTFPRVKAFSIDALAFLQLKHKAGNRFGYGAHHRTSPTPNHKTRPANRNNGTQVEAFSIDVLAYLQPALPHLLHHADPKETAEVKA